MPIPPLPSAISTAAALLLLSIIDTYSEIAGPSTAYALSFFTPS
ncbi:hypothetical protein [Spirosoma oryzae]|nr:hypothetical protein [Spirosoma oryzae]